MFFQCMVLGTGSCIFKHNLRIFWRSVVICIDMLVHAVGIFKTCKWVRSFYFKLFWEKRDRHSKNLFANFVHQPCLELVSCMVKIVQLCNTSTASGTVVYSTHVEGMRWKIIFVKERFCFGIRGKWMQRCFSWRKHFVLVLGASESSDVHVELS